MKKRPVAVLDACVLAPMPVADTLLRLAEPPAPYEPRWTDEILAGVTRTLVVRFGKSRESAQYREAAMRDFFHDSLVKDYELLVEKMTNHPKDRHVLAAAVACRADYLVTFNLKHFPPQSPGVHEVAVIGPSTFLKELFAIDRAVIEDRLCDQAKAVEISSDQLLERLAGSVPGFVSLLRRS